MADQVQLRRGTTAERLAFTGAQGEVTVDTDLNAAVVHDGLTPGGFPQASLTSVTNTTIYFDDDTGGGSAADAYLLTPKGSTRTPTTYADGLVLGFVTSNPNTGPSTVNFAGLGVKNVKLAGGSDPAGGQISGRVEMVFDSANDWFELQVAQPSISVEKAFWPKISNAADADHDITFSAGNIYDSTGALVISLPADITKQIDAAWSDGTTSGGLFSGTVAADTTYHCFLIVKDSDGSIDAGFDTDPNAANIPSGYTAYRRIHDIETDASANIKAFTQNGDRITLTAPDLIVSTGSPGTSGVLIKVAPSGPIKDADVEVFVENTSTTRVLVTSPSQADAAPDSTSQSITVGVAGTFGNITRSMATDSSGRIRYRLNLGTVTGFRIRSVGWRDDRSE